MSDELNKTENTNLEEQQPALENKVEKGPKTEEFNWDAIGKRDQVYSAKDREKLESLYTKTLSQITEKEVIEGTVIAKSDREIFVNIGFKSDGVIAANELRYNPDLKIGDVIEVYVESQEDGTGQLILSHKKARLLKAWDRINALYESGEIIKEKSNAAQKVVLL